MRLLARLFPRVPAADTPPHLALGERGEQLAAKFLRRRSYKILVRRYHTRRGEIDLVCRDGQTLVFVEVKTRTSEELGQPSEAVTTEKQRRLSRVALDYLRDIGNPAIQFRFDIVEVTMADPRHAADVRLIPNAFDLSVPYYY